VSKWRRRRTNESVNDGAVSYSAPPPNEGVDSIAELRFGRKDYEEYADEWIKEHRKLIDKYFKDKRKGLNVKYPDWRNSLNPPDPYAMKLIFHDPKKFGSVLFDPYLLEYVIYLDVDLFNSLIKYSRIKTDELIPGISRHITNLFIGKYKRILFLEEESSIYRQKSFIDLDYKSSWSRAFQIFETHGSIIVARWCLEKFLSDDNIWIDRMHELMNGNNISSLNVNVSKNVSITGDPFELDIEGGNEYEEDSSDDVINLLGSDLEGVEFIV
jgi:hypothetical protein